LELAEFGQGSVVGAFEVSAVTGDAVEFLGVAFVVDGVALEEELDFEGSGSAEDPATGEEALEVLLFEGAEWVRFGKQGEFVDFELFALVVGDAEGLGGEAFFAAVGGRLGLAFGGARAGGFLGVVLIGFDLRGRGHGCSSFVLRYSL
jgi:hypothetical protein